MPSSVLHITTACLVLGSAALGENRYTPTPFDNRIPMDFKLAADAVPDGGRGEGLGLWQHQGLALPETKGVHPIYVTSAPQGTVNGVPFKPGDVILGIEGEPLGPNPTRQFRDIVAKETRGSGLVWVARWRDGKVERIMVDLGTVPLDLTRGAPHNAFHEDTNLGATGAHGWIWAIPHESTEGATQIYVTRVDSKSPADGILKPGDVILGANGIPFTRDARRELGNALAVAESAEKQGKLTLRVWRDGKTTDDSLKMMEMGNDTPTSPFDCPKADLIRTRAAEFVSAKGITPIENDIGRRIIGNLGALGLLATGDPAYLPAIRARAHAMAATAKNLAFNLNREAWDWSYNNIFLAEYFLLTGDETVLPAIREFAVRTAEGQSRVGTWGHSMSVAYEFPDAAAAFMKELRWFYDLERRWEGNFVYQGKPGMIKRGNGEHSFADWDCTGARLLTYCVPQAKLRITGRGKSHITPITGNELDSIVNVGRVPSSEYATRDTATLLRMLSNWSPKSA